MEFYRSIGVDPADKKCLALVYVISLNLERRHLNERQRAMVGAKIANLASARLRKTPQICGINLPPARRPTCSTSRRTALRGPDPFKTTAP
jgi:hypothetical protein